MNIIVGEIQELFFFSCVQVGPTKLWNNKRNK